MTAAAGQRPVVVLRPGTTLPIREGGGKGAGLDRLVRGGFPVPDAAVVTASAFRVVVADPGLATLMQRLRSGAEVDAGTVDEAFLAISLPADLESAITGAAREVGGGGPVAVRSSATVEDLAAASFAGQYRSSLDVLGDEAVLRATRLTWASLWHPAPRAYRFAWGIDEDEIAMAVVLMRMVPARLAGVVFTVDPAGTEDMMRVEAVPELGESLVSGARTPDVWLLPRRPPENAVAPPPIRQAAALALRAERDFGAPQDVEWAWDGDRVWLVQARPITAGLPRNGDGCDTAIDGSDLTTAGIGEMLPGVLSPLLWDVNSFLVEEALRNVLGELWALPADRHGPHEFIRRVRGQAALNLDLIKAAAAALPGGSEAELERQYFGVSTAPEEATAPPARLRVLRHALRAAAARRHAAVEADVVLGAVDAVASAAPDLASRTDAELLAYRRRLLDLGARAMTVELAVSAAAVAAYRQVEAFLIPHLGDEAVAAAQRVTAGAGTARQVTPQMSRSIFAGPSWRETGAHALPLHISRRAEREEACRQVTMRLASTPRWRRIRILTGQVVDIRMRLFRRLVGDATAGLLRREQVKAAVLTVGGEVRRVHCEVGRRMTTAGSLAAPDDVDLLRDAELRGALEGHGPPPAELARRRRCLDRWAEGPLLPVRFSGELRTDDDATSSSADRLTGLAASGGRLTARARVVSDPVHGRLEPGEVLVAAATDAGWSPLFLRAGAVVAERGGPLSHAAILARELGIPAVLNVRGAARRLDGRLVTVDGDRGLVLVHKTGSSEAVSDDNQRSA